MEYLIRYGEIALKSRPVRSRMEDALVGNICGAFKKEGVPLSIQRSFGRIFLKTSQSEKAESLLKRIFGIVSFSPCFATSSSLEKVTSLALSLAQEKSFKTFAVKTTRVGIHPFTSQDVNKKVGEEIRTRLKKQVNLSNPGTTFFIEVRDKKAYLYTIKLRGQGGFPLGTQGTAACELRSGRDLLACWMMMRRGCSIIPVKAKTAFLKTLESWAFNPLRPASTLKGSIRKGALGIVTSDTGRMQSLKEKHALPVYNPLLGLEESGIKRMLKVIKLTES